MTKVRTIGQEIAENDLLDEVSDQTALDKIAALIDGHILEAFKTGFEHATAGGEEAGRRMPQLKGAMPLVLYVGDEATRRELIDLFKATHPNASEARIPERVKRA